MICLYRQFLLAAPLIIALTAPSPAQQRKPLLLRPDLAPVASQAPPPAPFPKTAAIVADPAFAPEAPPKPLVGGILLGDVGYSNGFRFSNLAGRREIFIPVPEGVALNFSELSLSLDDVSAHEARRSLEILVNDRSVSAVPLDGKGSGRVLRIPLTNVVSRDGFLKLTFLYSGAATQDRCIDVRYIGDSLTILPDTAIEYEVRGGDAPNVTGTAALMPQKVAILLTSPQLSAEDVATALTLARSLITTGRRVVFHHGVDALPGLVKREDGRKWSQGLIVVGPMDRVAGRIDPPALTLAGMRPGASLPVGDSSLAAVRIGGVPVLLVTSAASARAGRLLGNSSLAVLRDTPTASINAVVAPKGTIDRVSFDELGLVPAQADVFGRADLTGAIAIRNLPSGTRASRMLLDVMVAPDGAGEKAVVSAFVNERLLASTVAAIGEPTRLDFALPDGLVGTVANIKTVIQRRSAQGDCRFEPQGYPAQLLGSSSIVLSSARAVPQDFSDLVTLWGNGIEVSMPASMARRPLAALGLMADVLAALSSEAAPIVVRFVEDGATPTPGSPFIVTGDVPPAGSAPGVLFDRGRVAIADRAGRTRLDVGGLTTGAVAQIVTSGSNSGLWIRSLARDGSLPISPAVHLDRGDVAFIDRTGVALALSSERDTLLQVSYPDRDSWWSLAARFQSWIIGGLWALLTLVILYVVQRNYRRRAATVE